MLESELFGHERGAFTGADHARGGRFETAHGGTLFLDEIGELPRGAQVRSSCACSRRARSSEWAGVGQVAPNDVRVVAATHADSTRRSSVVAFAMTSTTVSTSRSGELPPLRDRRDDMLLLAQHFLAAYDARLRLARDAEQQLLACAWPGNVRELRSVLQVAAEMHEGDGWLLARDLELPSGPRLAVSYHGALDAERRRLLGEALSAAGGRRAEAARRLGITPQGVPYLVRRLGLEAS